MFIMAVLIKRISFIDDLLNKHEKLFLKIKLTFYLMKYIKHKVEIIQIILGFK